MELYLLGTGTCHPAPGRTPPCYYLNAGPERFIIDPGPGAVSRMVEAGVDPFDVEAILITHLHLDHCADLLPYLFTYKNCVEGPKRDVHILAPLEFRTAFAKLMDVFGQWVISDDYRIEIVEMSSDTWEAPGYAIRSLPMLHSANAVGFRVEKPGGPSFAYSGDSGYCQELLELAAGVDLLLAECSFPEDDAMEGHLSAGELAQVAVASGCKRLALTHMTPKVNPAKAVEAVRKGGYRGEVFAGHDGMRIKF
ncbi:MAG: MBL fold metallo-hydrolase [Nitrospinae bacterium]|nr:MBL fold metallo-hydrolase [Nitrospinota bacterium]